MIWHSSESKDILAALQTDQNLGLSQIVAEQRLHENGENTLQDVERKSYFSYFLSQFKNKLVIAILIVALISFVLALVYQLHSPWSCVLLAVMVLLNAAISAAHLYFCNRSFESVRGGTNPDVKVIRGGNEMLIPSSQLAQGDILLLAAGDFITADARLIESTELRCNEALVTGSTVPVEKYADALPEDIERLENRKNMVYSGSSVLHGSAKAVVVATGLATEIGRFSTLGKQTGDDRLPLQTSLNKAGRIVNILVAVLCVIYFVLGILSQFSAGHFAEMTVEMLLKTLVLAFAAIPESLPAVSAIVISVGIARIIRDNILIKKTGVVELFGKTDLICADKTGIFTHNSMELNTVYDGNRLIDLTADPIGEKGALLLKLAATCHTLENDPTENAIAQACLDYNAMTEIDLENLFPRMCSIPFDPARKTMTTVNMMNRKPFAIIKGAPEVLIEKCANIDSAAVLRINDEMAEKGLRVVCIAMRPLSEIPANPSADELEQNLLFIGLLGLQDLPRNQAINGVKMCDDAGIRTVMMTGDNPLTACAIARRIGILKDGTECITGAQLAEMDDETLCREIDRFAVFARISPRDKARIVRAWQAHGACVTVTGDGTEDAEALSQADIGCSLGQRGTDIAQGTADVVLADNSFLSLVNAIKESRGLFDNIRKLVCYLLSCNIGELLLFMVSILFWKVAPLSAVQLLWINLLTDVSPAFALSLETAEGSVMKRKPISLSGKIADVRSVVTVLVQGVYIAAVSALAYLIGNAAGSKVAATMAFLTLGMVQIFHTYNLKTSHLVFSRLTKDLFANRVMNISSAICLMIMLFLAFTPAGFLFDFAILGVGQFFICLGLAFGIIPVCECLKLLPIR